VGQEERSAYKDIKETVSLDERNLHEDLSLRPWKGVFTKLCTGFAEQHTVLNSFRVHWLSVDLLLVSPLAEAEPDFLADFSNPHAFGHEQLAGQRSASLRAFARVVAHAAVLAILIPAKAAVGNWFGGEVLQAAQNRIVFWNFDLLLQKFDGNQT
jgi:hypothetical protein